MNKLIQGDCLEVMKEMEDNSVDYVFTSPPYNRKRNDKYEQYSDTLNDYYSSLIGWTDEMLRVSINLVFINIQKNYYQSSDVYRFIGNYHKEIKEIIIWEKSNPMPASGNSITNAYEFIFVMSNKDIKLKSKTTYTKNHLTTSVNPDTDKRHKAIMNKAVSDWCLEKFIPQGCLVLDPFMGLGTTALSAIKNKCNFIGIEISEEYCKIAQARIGDIEITN